MPEKTHVCRTFARLVCTACCTLEQTNILAKPFRFLHLSRFAMMILSFLSFLSACAACHICEDPTFERITSTTIVESKEVGFSGLLVILENSIRELAEKQAKMTSSMNITNIADYAVSIKRRNNGAPLLHADSCNMTYYNNYTNSSHSTSPNTPHYHLFHSHTPPLPESPSPPPAGGTP